MPKNPTPKIKQVKAVKPAAVKAAVKCIALNVGHRSCPCPDCSYNAPKK
jgi:hypothetical protein